MRINSTGECWVKMESDTHTHTHTHTHIYIVVLLLDIKPSVAVKYLSERSGERINAPYRESYIYYFIHSTNWLDEH